MQAAFEAKAIGKAIICLRAKIPASGFTMALGLSMALGFSMALGVSIALGFAMESTAIFRIFGAILIILGLVLAANPELVSNKPIPSDTFRAIERRIWWGLLIGIGILLQFHHQWLPWQRSVSALCVSLLVGLLIARLIGIGLDGSVAKQWLNLGIEIIILVPFLWWYINVSK